MSDEKPATPDTTPAAAPGADEAFDAETLEIGRRLFAGPAEFYWATAKIDGLPPMQDMEIAFAGRSNVGKSSLVNALTGRNTLARTSNTPGRTQQLNFFRIGPEWGQFSLVDMPGYGFAAVGKEKVAAWTRLIQDYLRGRASLARVYVLIDSRHGVKQIDTNVLDGLDRAAVSYQVILTKADALKKSELEARIAAIRQSLLRRPAAFPQVLATSSRSGAGVEEVRAAVVQLMRERGFDPVPPT
ncbi:putative GTP-binding protein EngB [Camelimonas fluminis]|uniref:Probable GTP-binding protein EngB n=1 Tax=Camelimonas fluminis TaxID=1576911 RepID=A0ABV7UBS7_9HYPH|nr:ribosome biogenesis GTP-binding protein YihA/YsxC [Camelimonas fluminis]GHE64634.1 putative GTP-binding protein EngB [Camelimonas fluminis]